MNSEAVCPNSRCSSLKSSRTKTSAGRGRRREKPPAASAHRCLRRCLGHVDTLPTEREACSRARRSPERLALLWLTCLAGRKYKPDNVPTINELFRLDGRIAIVTGGSRGIGQEMAGGPRRGRRVADAVRAPRRMADADRRQNAQAGLQGRRRAVRRLQGVGRPVGRRQDDRRLRPRRHPDQQRRRHLGGRARGHDAGAVAEGRRHQPDRRVPVRAGGGPRHADARSGAASSTSRRLPACTRRCRGRTTRRTPRPRPG